MKKYTRKQPLWYNPAGKGSRNLLREEALTHLASDREGRALLESYIRMYRKKL